MDIVAHRFDAGVRTRSIDQDMLIGSLKFILVASRDYLNARGMSKSIADLPQHNCIGIRTVVSGAVFDWVLIDGKNRQP